MATQTTFRQMVRHFSPAFRARGKVLQSFSKRLGLLYFGTVNQHDDEHDAIRGFTASLGHKDTHYAVGTYNGHNIRMVDRFDVVKIAGTQHEQFWSILEIEIENAHALPHIFFIPTGSQAGEYGRVFTTHPNMQPLNSMLFAQHSPEFHGRFQILSNPSLAHRFEQLFTSPTILTIASRFWPHGIEINNGKVLIYITEHRLTKTVLDTAMSSGLWLAETIQELVED